MLRTAILSMLLGAVACAAHAAGLGDELLLNGSFETAAPSGDRPADWSWQPEMKWENDGGKHWAVAEAQEAATRSIGQTVPLEEAYWKIRVSCRVRVTDVAQGVESWHDARIAMQFQGDDGAMVGAYEEEVD